LYDQGFFKKGDRAKMHQALVSEVASLRPHLIPLIEAFYIPDSRLMSSIGNSYGDIYHTQIKLAKNSRLNKRSVPGYYEKYMTCVFPKL